MNDLISLEKIAQWQKLKMLVLDSVPDYLNFARPVVVAVPQEVRDAATNLHAGKTFAQLWVTPTVEPPLIWSPTFVTIN